MGPGPPAGEGSRSSGPKVLSSCQPVLSVYMKRGIVFPLSAASAVPVARMAIATAPVDRILDMTVSCQQEDNTQSLRPRPSLLYRPSERAGCSLAEKCRRAERAFGPYSANAILHIARGRGIHGQFLRGIEVSG